MFNDPSLPFYQQLGWPFVVVLASVAFIVFAIGWLRMHAMLALIMAALVAGLLSFKSEWTIVEKNGTTKTYSGMVGTIELTSKGLGDTARDIAISIALASIIGMCLMESGAADKVVRRFLGVFGEKRAGWALLWSTYVLSIPIFFDTMFMLMVPLAKALGRRTGKDYMLYAMCVACGGVITHSMTIPHPGPLAMVADLKLDAGTSLAAGLLGGVIPAIVGYYVCVWVNRRIPASPNRDQEGNEQSDVPEYVEVAESSLPSFFQSIVPVLLPIVLISFASFAQIIQEGATKQTKSAWCVSIYEAIGAEGLTKVRSYIDFFGNKNIALFVGALLAVIVLVVHRKLDRKAIESLMGPPLATAGMIILITSAGGAFGGMLRAVGVGDAVKTLAADYNINLLVLAWLVASVLRVAQGSATVAMLTTASMIMPMIEAGNALDCHILYLYLVIGWGAMSGSWMNDSGFWVVSRLGGFTQRETLQSWSLMLLIVSIVGFFTAFIASRIVPLV
jgi:gluconate:H+ symporter, GntP family